ncbi:MAG: hypothetical protein K6A72_10855 [Lachnospiraceae bacterium]|nr:hypothetical protein [Lachnospiraceae bacterium]
MVVIAEHRKLDGFYQHYADREDFMSVHKISSTNIEKYRKLLPKTACENVLRACYRGVVSEGEKGISIIIWEMINEPKTGEKRADVRYIVNKDTDAFDDVFDYLLDYADRLSLDISFEIAGNVTKTTSDYLKKKGFPVEKGEGKDVLISVKDLVDVTEKYRVDIPDYMKSLGELNFGELGRVIRKCLYCGTTGVVYDLETINMSFFERNISCCLYFEGEVLGVFLLHKNAEENLEICVLAGFSDDPADIMYMLCYTAMEAESYYTEDTKIVIRRNNSAMSELAAKLFPGAECVPVIKDSKK